MSLKQKIPGSNCKDPENRSKKLCCCGGHSVKAKKKFTRDTLRVAPECSVVKFNSRICELGTKGCMVVHGVETPPEGI